MHPDNLLDIEIADNYRFTLPPFFHMNDNNRLVFTSEIYEQQQPNTNLQLNSRDLAETMGYISTLIRLLQLRYERY